jgi:putative tryptophan/tyrosine transport system substrate-binding protein
VGVDAGGSGDSMKQFWIFDFGFWIQGSKGKREFCLVLAALLFAVCVPAEAQEAAKVPRVGYISLRSGIEPREQAFQKGLRELGYIEGQNIIIEWRFAKGKEDLLPKLVNEVIQLKVDVIVAAGTQAIQAAKQATNTIPVVIGQVGDPVQLGFVNSLARPGGNITGFSTLSTDLASKRLELLKEAVPKVSRVAFVRDLRNPAATIALRETEEAARALGVLLRPLEIRSTDDVEKAFQAARKWRAEGLILMGAGIFARQQDRERAADLEVKTRLPVMHSAPELVLAGGLMSYAPDIPEQFRRAAAYVDKILKGIKPADLPVEQPTKFEFVINLKTAKQIGLTIPQWVLMRADRVIR